MAISKNLLMQGTSGTINKQVVFRNYGDKLVVSAYPDMSNRKLSEKQIKQTELMVEANEYAQDVVADEKARNDAQVRLDVPRNKLYRSLVKEYFATQKAKA